MGSCLGGESRSPRQSPLKRRKKSMSMSMTTSSSFKEEHLHLHRIPGRMFLNGSSEFASLYTQQGKKGTNQDAMIVWEDFGSRRDTVFCGVFDGHGPFGHMVAKRAWKDLFLNAFKVMDRELRMHTNIDCFCSGSTAVTLIKQGEDLIIGNVGDSRAILCTRDERNSLVALQLTVDLKPNLPAEAERIRKSKGRVFALQEEPSVTRVWLPNNDSPGLAMARAFGDFCLKDFGLISIPDIFYRRLTENDQFVVLASDGIWDVLTNKDVIDIVASAESRSCAARAVVESAVRAWNHKYPTSKVDDCAVVCLFLTPPPNTISMASGTTQIREEEEEEGIGTTDVEEDLVDHVLDEDPDGGDVIHWSALDGVTRANTLLNLPEFMPEEPHNKKTN
ncbi:putative protein-serine/threonine phosphatase [Helianthus annuus]|nr:putative protein-serine/threonine phosphatase [Helianthus annuus]